MSPSVNATTPRLPLATALLFKKQLILLALLLGSRFLATYAIPDDVDSSGAKKTLHLSLPRQMGDWSGRTAPVNPAIYELLHPDAVVQKRYRLSPVATSASLSSNKKWRGPEVEVLIVYSRDPRGFHSPVTCMRSIGWTVVSEVVKPVTLGAQSFDVNILSGEIDDGPKGLRHTTLAYCFTDADEAVSGRIATFTKMVLARFMRRRVGAVEMQFAYDAPTLQPNGEFTPQFKQLMLQTAATVRRQLAADQ